MTTPTRADLARYNRGVRLAVDTYVAEQNGYVRCRRNHARPVDGRCITCDSLTRGRIRHDTKESA